MVLFSLVTRKIQTALGTSSPPVCTVHLRLDELREVFIVKVHSHYKNKKKEKTLHSRINALLCLYNERGEKMSSQLARKVYQLFYLYNIDSRKEDGFASK